MTTPYGERDAALQVTSPRFVSTPPPTNGLNNATVFIFQRTMTNVAPALPSASTTYTYSPAGLTGLTNGWSFTPPDASNGAYLWVSTSVASSTNSSTTLLAGSWSTAQLQAQNGATGGTGPAGSSGVSVGTAMLFQWSTVAPSNPTGTANFNWATGVCTSYTASDGWQVTAPANPGVQNTRLYIAQKGLSAPAGTASTTVDFTTGIIVFALSQNGANGATGSTGAQGVPGIKNAIVHCYQWGNGPAPTATGTATLNWSTVDYDNLPTTGWSKSKPASPGNGYTLFEASLSVLEASTATTTAFNWANAVIVGISYTGLNGSNGTNGTNGATGATGNSAVIAYVLVDGFSLNSTPATISKTGGALPASGDWGSTRAWSTSPPVAAAGQSVFQSMGVQDSSGNVTWGLPFMSAFRVASLSAFTANLGSITAGNIDLGSGSTSWHVDSGGNMWLGASTFPDAPFRVDNQGNARLRSASIEDATGNVILAAGVPLAKQTQMNENLCPIPSTWPPGNRYSGTNIAYNYANPNSKNGEFVVLPSNAGASYIGAESASLGIPANTYYTVSFDAQCDSTRPLTVDLYNSANCDTTGISVNLTTAWQHFSFTEIMTSAEAPLARIRLYVTSVTGGQAYVANLKVEYGTVASAWCDSFISANNVSQRVLPSAIGNTQFGGDLLSTNWNGGTDKNGTGWRLDRGGNLLCNSLTARGYIAGGDYTGYAWPAAGGTGFYLGPSGLLLGNYNNGQWFQVDSSGNVSAPTFSIGNGVATFSGTLSVKSAASGARTEMTNSAIKVYDTSGNLRCIIGSY